MKQQGYNEPMSPITRRTFALLAPTTAAGVVLGATASAMADDARQPNVVVFCEETLRPALENAGRIWQRRVKAPLHIFVARTDLLLEQIARGARCDLLVMAGEASADTAIERKLVRPEFQLPAWRNRLVVVGRDEAPAAIATISKTNLVEIVGADKFAIADWTVSPAGMDAKRAFENLGVWPSLEGKIVGSESTAGVAFLMAAGKAKRGVVYATDAAANPRLSVVAIFPDESYPPIVYVAALTFSDASGEALSFWEFLHSSEAEVSLQASGLGKIG